jgi:tetratricopeptide (TPR) repeat protein
MAAVRTRDPRLPYPGPRPFANPERDRFFGRAAEAVSLADLWRENRLIMAYGQAGSGKTSLLSAGVLPLVTGGKADVTPLGRFSYGAAFPDAALPEHNPLALALLRSWSPGENATRLVGLSIRDYLAERAERHNGPILAVIDQTEELLADPGPRGHFQRRLLDELAMALVLSPQLHLLLLIREYALEAFSAALGPGVQFHLGPLSPENAVDAVVRPVDGAGRSFAPGAAEALVADLLTSRIVAADGQVRSMELDQVEPALLQAACAGLWESLPPDVEVITTRHIRQYGDADVTLAAHCGEALATVADDHDLSSARLRSWLTRTFITEHGDRGDAYMGLINTAGMPNAVPRALEDRHLLCSSWRSGARWFRLLSDRLIQPLRLAPDTPRLGVDPAGFLGQAERALTVGDLDLAQHYGRRVLLTAPGHAWRLRAEANSLLGNLARERGFPAQAEAHYQVAADFFEAVQDTAAVASQLAAVGQTMLDQGESARAVRELRAAVDRAPRDLIVQTKLGWALWHVGQGRAAVAVLTAVLETEAGNLEALRARGEMLADLGDAADALHDLNRAAGREWPSTRAARGLALATLGRPDAEADIQAALDDGPRNGPVLLYAARAEVLRGDRAAATELASHALDATDPALPPHQREMAQALLDREPA